MEETLNKFIQENQRSFEHVIKQQETMSKNHEALIKKI